MPLSQKNKGKGRATQEQVAVWQAEDEMRLSYTEGLANNEDGDSDTYGQLPAHNNQDGHENASPSNSQASRHEHYTSEPDDELDSEIEDQKDENATPSKHAPLRQRGQKYRLADGQDQDTPTLGEVQNSLCYISFVDLRGQIIEYKYIHRAEMDWNDPNHIKKLTNWRKQIFRRNLGSVTTPRAKWTELDIEVLGEIIATYLDESGKDEIDDETWDRVAGIFNDQLRFVRQYKGDPSARFFRKGGKLTQRSQLAEDRFGCDRKGLACKVQASKSPYTMLILSRTKNSEKYLQKLEEAGLLEADTEQDKDEEEGLEENGEANIEDQDEEGEQEEWEIRDGDRMEE